MDRNVKFVFWSAGNLISQTFAPALYLITGRSVRLESRNHLAKSKLVFWKRKHEMAWHVGCWWKPLPQSAAFFQPDPPWLLVCPKQLG